MNKYIQQSESVEQIIAAAIRLKGGRIYQSHSHSRCMFDAIANGEKGPVDCEQGFVTNEGRFVSRTEAMTIAYKAKQTHKSEGELFSEDVTYPQMKSPPHKEHGEETTIEIWKLDLERLIWSYHENGRPDGKTGVIGNPKTIREFVENLLLSTQQEAVEKERVRAKAAWRAAESHGKLIYPNPYGNSLTVKRHNQVIYEMREKFYSAFTPKETV